MPVQSKNVSDVLANAVVQEREGQKPRDAVAKDAISAILANGVTKDERAQVAQMLKVLDGTPHAALAHAIFEGVSKGADATGFQELKEKITGPKAEHLQPSVTWKENIPTPTEQRAWNAEVTTTQLALAPKNGVVGRGFHEKQIFGGAVTMKVNADLPAEARIPPFWDDKTNKPADLSGVVRMSNGQGCPYKDSGPDVRGLAFKLVDGAGKSWDVLTTNKQTFAEDAPQFIGFTAADREAQLAENPVVGQAKMGVVLAEKVGVVQAARITGQLAKDTVFHQVNSMVTESFDGGTFKTPDGRLAKMILTPVPNAVATMTRHDMEKDDKGLTTDMYRHFQSGPVKYRVQLKIFCGNGDELKANDKWEPAKIVDVGELTIPPPDKANDQKIQTIVNGMRFNLGNGFQPAGQIAHARGAQPGVNGDYEVDGIYKKSADNRLALVDDAATLALAKSIGNGTADQGKLDATFAEVSKRNAQMAKEIADGTLADRLKP